MPSVDQNGPPWGVRTLRADWRYLDAARDRPPRRRGLVASAVALVARLFAPPELRHQLDSDDDPDSGAAGAGDRAPLVPRPPVISGAAARRVPLEPEDVSAVAQPRTP